MIEWISQRSVELFLLLLVVVGTERLVELGISRRNARWAFARGGIEFGAEHFGVMKVAHTLLLIGAAAEVLLLGRAFVPAIGLTMLALTLGSQALRYAAVNALGSRWNVRVIVVPGMRAERRGPYRYLRHPNYLAVVVEGLALPLVHSAYATALLFGIANLFILRERIRCEEAALARYSSYREVFPSRPSVDEAPPLPVMVESASDDARRRQP